MLQPIGHRLSLRPRALTCS